VGVVGETDAAIEPLVGVVVSDADLELDGFGEFALLAFCEHVVDALLEEVGVNFAH